MTGAYQATDRRALDAVLSVEPAWTALVPAREALAIGPRTILHAGPPIRAGGLSQPIRNSVLAAMQFEGWAGDFAEADAMLAAGEVTLAPAQDSNAMVPLAAVLSPNMLVHVVTDRRDPARVAYSPINGGNGPAMRLGLAEDRVVAHLRWVNGAFAEALGAAFREPIDLIPIADRALAEGDDCHGRTVRATALLLEKLRPTFARDSAGQRAIEFMHGSPSLFLNLWMAASKCMASAGALPGSSVVTALGSNGIEAGLQVGGLAGRWFVGSAAPPNGRLEPGVADGDRLGAIGDSALVDGLGLGAMAMAFAPEQAKVLAAFLDEPSEHLARDLLFAPNPQFAVTSPYMGLAARRVVATGKTIAVALGMLDRAGKKGRIGGGIYRPPLALFDEACRALDGAA
jgi:hypothetical protein